ncbi:alkyl hydroperoxide reductase [Chitinophaga caeni]|uniref:Alkyl hydroperoxide reductase n=1 Tax=Chitinophaga caeni TaxID=2029983 RepID=A0A291QW99_9BACT|nr:TlpA disulfide reductase family protein [Chitinophaga caeni]ATL48238.1 alkyl hydroperoxide reductase [Chitinophaga caeni]
MRLKKWWSILLLFPTMAIAQDKFTISGNISSVEGQKMVVLSYLDNHGKEMRDTSLLHGGKFSFNGFTAYANRAHLALEPLKRDTTRRRVYDVKEFYLAKGNYTVTGSDGKMSAAEISGTQVQEEFKEYRSKMDPVTNAWIKLTDEYSEAVKEKDSLTIQKLRKEAPGLRQKLDDTMNGFIYSHPDSYLSVDLVYFYRTGTIEPATFDPLFNALNPALLQSFTGKKLVTTYDNAKQLFAGKTVDFTQMDEEGKPFKLSSLRGQYVLVDFWASWCKPCRAENPNLLKAYQDLKDQNFTIVSVSLDESKAGWLYAVKQDGLPWKQVCNMTGFKTGIAVDYGISAIPQNVLVDPDGKVVAKNLRGENLTEQVKKYIK